jgi:diguanylate cyclase (GGDEF)-like protein
MRAILDAIREPFIVLDARLHIRLANQSFCQTFQVEAKNVLGEHIRGLGADAWGSPALTRWLTAFVAKRSEIPTFEMTGLFPTVGQRTIVFHARHVKVPKTGRRITLLSMEDRTQRDRAASAMGKLNESLKSDSMTDLLTGLYNRRGYMVLAQHYLDLAHRRGKRVFVIYADVDGLKEMNDKQGHKGGDALLIRVARILRKTFRKSDIVARLGGDEFVIASMENGHDTASVQASRLLRNLNHHQTAHKAPISLSMGVARSNRSGTSSIEELTSRADKLMYLEKNRKKNRKK